MTYQDRDRVIAWLDAGHGDKLTPLDRITLVTIAENVNGKTSVAFPGHELLIGRWGMSAASVKRAIARLCRLGLIEISQRGTWGRRSRYKLAGELTVDSVDHEPQRAHSEPLTGSHRAGIRAHSEPRLSESSRSSNGEKTTDDGAARSAPEGALRAAPRQAIPVIQQEIMDALGYGLSEAKEWAKAKVAGKNPRNIDAYLRKCLDNHVASTHRKPATKEDRSSEFVCPRCGRGFTSKSSLGSHAGHCATTQCPDCGGTVKTRDLDEHRRMAHNWKPPFTAFKDGLADQLPCVHGVPGGSVPYQGAIPGPGSLYGWMACPQCRVNSRRPA